MGEFASGKWVIGLLIYFFIFFVVMQNLLNAKAVLGAEDDRLNYSDPGFTNQANIFINSSTATGECDDKGLFENKAMSFTGAVYCERLPIFNSLDCGNVSGCNWVNLTDLVGSFCGGLVNKTHYNITGGIYNYCGKGGLEHNQTSCLLFNCNWLEYSSNQGSFDVENPRSVVTTWQTFKWVLGWNVDIGLGPFNSVFAFLFFYIPFIMLLYAIYMMIPFFH